MHWRYLRSVLLWGTLLLVLWGLLFLAVYYSRREGYSDHWPIALSPPPGAVLLDLRSDTDKGVNTPECTNCWRMEFEIKARFPEVLNYVESQLRPLGFRRIKPLNSQAQTFISGDDLATVGVIDTRYEATGASTDGDYLIVVKQFSKKQEDRKVDARAL